MLVDSFRVESPHVEYTEDMIKSSYEYQTTEFLHEQRKSDGKYEWVAKPKSVPYQFATQRKVPKLGYGAASVTHVSSPSLWSRSSCWLMQACMNQLVGNLFRFN